MRWNWGCWFSRTQGDPARFQAHESLVLGNSDHWLANEVIHFWKRVLKRIDVTSRSMSALVEHGSCFIGILAEILWAVDRTYMMKDEFEEDDRPCATITLTEANFGLLPMSNDLTPGFRHVFLATLTRLSGPGGRNTTRSRPQEAEEIGLVTMVLDDIDWEDEIRIFEEERASFSPDAMTGMEANLRFAGPETMETRIFGRLTAWQNWIFNRPNAAGPRRCAESVRHRYARRLQQGTHLIVFTRDFGRRKTCPTSLT